MRTLTDLAFDNTYARLPAAFYARVSPTTLARDPYLVSFNSEAAALLDLDPSEAETPQFVEYFSGSRILPGADPIAALYAGHQFGSYVEQLGDGRAILMGEVRNRRNEKWDVQLKGAGPTPFSRGFDGRAVLRSTIREYLCSEAMHGLGIPTTRALCLVASDDPVRRETLETAAVLTRLAPSHVRFGTFEVFFHRGQLDHVRLLADDVIGHHHPALADRVDKYEQFLREVVRGTACLIAEWQAVGFAHGVMNTDNMSILGLTIDYGPFGFMNTYDSAFVPNHSDEAGSYAFNRQPRVGLWNLGCFAQTLLGLVSREQAVDALATYEPLFLERYERLIRAKLGLRDRNDHGADEQRDRDRQLAADFLEMAETNAVDYTTVFRRLGRFTTLPGATNDAVRSLFQDRTAFDRWASDYRERLLSESSDDHERRQRMDRANPKFVLRNHLAQTAIAHATDERNFTEIDRLLALLRRPYDEQPGMERYAEAPSDSSTPVVVSCSS